MAEFKEVIKQFNRMCDSQKWCDSCQINDNRGPFVCSRWLTQNATEAEEIIMTWAKEHPIITNDMKFKEIFGREAYRITVFDDTFVKWLNKEYKEPKDE